MKGDFTLKLRKYQLVFLQTISVFSIIILTMWKNSKNVIETTADFNTWK